MSDRQGWYRGRYFEGLTSCMAHLHGHGCVVEEPLIREGDGVGEDGGDAPAHDGVKEAAGPRRVAARDDAELRVVHLGNVPKVTHAHTICTHTICTQ